MQPSFELISPRWERSQSPDVQQLRRLVLDLPDDYWLQGNGQVTIKFDGKTEENELLVSPNKEFGIALKIFSTEFDWLSLHDRSRLAEITTVSEDWLTSVGLFLPPEAAWIAIEEFCRTGERSSAVEWIKSTDMPPDSNW
jgi:hypothetical protein